jgi:hypothetical protein
LDLTVAWNFLGLVTLLPGKLVSLKDRGRTRTE